MNVLPCKYKCSSHICSDARIEPTTSDAEIRFTNQWANVAVKGKDRLVIYFLIYKVRGLKLVKVYHD